MKIELKPETKQHFIKVLAEDKVFAKLLSDWAERSNRYGLAQFTLNLSLYSTTALKRLYEHAKVIGDRSVMMNISALINVRKDPRKGKVSLITTLTESLSGYLIADCIDGWLYEARDDGFYQPWVATNIKYFEPERDTPASVAVYLAANIATFTPDNDETRARGENKVTTRNLRFGSDNLPNTPAELFQSHGFFKETPELRAQYDEQIRQFNSVRKQPSAQFWFQGKVSEAIRSRDYYLSRSDMDILEPIKVINDEKIVQRAYTESANPEFWRGLAQSAAEQTAQDNDEGGSSDKLKEAYSLDVKRGFNSTPVHPMALIFDLSKHQHYWAHSSLLKPYVYKPELKDSLVLPTEHRDMIDILATDIDIVAEDVIEGKSGGTLLACMGRPGLGKTLTPEVYSEVIGRPHYRVTAGTIGVEPIAVEKSLKVILKRAARWGAVTTLDEADIYIRRRGDDIVHNAILATFLQQLEYFPGVLFVTTNREDDVDDAFLSRCSAIIRYKTPTPEDAFEIWRIQAKLHGIVIDDLLRQRLIKAYPTASGRDIRNLCKITTKYLRAKGQEPNYEAFRLCAQFRNF